MRYGRWSCHLCHSGKLYQIFQDMCNGVKYCPEHNILILLRLVSGYSSLVLTVELKQEFVSIYRFGIISKHIRWICFYTRISTESWLIQCKRFLHCVCDQFITSIYYLWATKTKVERSIINSYNITHNPKIDKACFANNWYRTSMGWNRKLFLLKVIDILKVFNDSFLSYKMWWNCLLGSKSNYFNLIFISHLLRLFLRTASLGHD